MPWRRNLIPRYHEAGDNEHESRFDFGGRNLIHPMHLDTFIAYTKPEMQLPIEHIEGFDWDWGNVDKNWESHEVLYTEAEEIFFNEPLIVNVDIKHSNHAEERYQALGRTDNNRYLFIAFTIRKKLIRVISSRDMSRKERKLYDEKS